MKSANVSRNYGVIDSSAMPNIITRYLTREILKSSLATVLVLFVILMSNTLGRLLAEITDGEVPQQALFPVLLSQAVSIFSLLLPVSFFLGIVLAFGRLYKDHEIVVMNACGMGYREFYRPVVIILIPLVLFSAYSNIWLNAQILSNVQELVEREKNVYEFDRLKAGQFNQGDNAEQVFYM
ncbi:MAG: LptF/LptG family permease, partial [Alteromonadales bacterium]|nr:LptF/LptG family permease [Alteromonadales bacterium]